MSKLKQLKERTFQKSVVRREYESLAEEFEFINALLKMRTAAGLTQDELAHRIGTNKSSISRLEKGGNPRWGTLKKYAHACGFALSLNFSAA